MNAEIFDEWVKDLCSVVDEPSLILLDNASYHSRQREKRRGRSVIYKIGYKKTTSQIMLRIKRILCLISGETITRKKKYVEDEIIEQAGH
jgi:hypothetical protein